MPVRDRRKDSVGVLFLRGLVFIVAGGLALFLWFNAIQSYGNPSSEIKRWQANPVLPHVFVKGTLARRTSEDLPALCTVEREDYVSCGKNRCWKTQASMGYTNAVIHVAWSSSPLPEKMNVEWTFREEPWRFPGYIATERSAAWRNFAAKNQITGIASYSPSSSSRLVEYCADSGDNVTIEACVSTSKPSTLEPCTGDARFGVVYNGDDQAARDDGADDIAMQVACGMIAALIAALAWVRTKKPIVEGLEDRAPPHQRGLGIAWGLLGVPPVAGLVALLLHAAHPPSTYASGRGGFCVAFIALAAWLFLMLQRLRYRANTLAALGPVLSTPRKPLAQASGTCELSVRAKIRDGGVRAFIGDDVVAYSEITIWETYTQGKNTSKQEVLTSRQRNTVGVVDVSSEGTLDLQRSILEVELREARFVSLSPRYAERGISPIPHPRHIQFIVREHVIKDNEQLFVFGDVSGISLQSDEGGYRTVRGSPTLGGADATPVLVYSGSQRGLVEMLEREARIANVFALVAICLCGVMGITLGALAML